ncbi:hypothetical protein HPB50_002908 [Hyalomma asiaticum]|uniref:Uncharacterized protein n=1 Tax=Hyalomma asiaticum TaxID=266040 RepID=A0ACB7TDT4_HYAAI|nr:hypothetical protein HPB50_002908 [Hyalomma asiaticum]
MNVVRVGGVELLLKEFGKEQGWCEIKRNTKKAAPTDGDPATNQQSVAAYTMRVKHYVRKITKPSQMPNLLTDDFKIVVRLRNGFNVSNYQKDHIHCYIHNVAGVGRDTAEEDISPMTTQKTGPTDDAPHQGKAAATALRPRENTARGAALAPVLGLEPALAQAPVPSQRGIAADRRPERTTQLWRKEEEDPSPHSGTAGGTGGNGGILRNWERPDVILLQETNDDVKLAGYKAIDEAVTAGAPPAAAALVRRNLNVAQRELQNQIESQTPLYHVTPKSTRGSR